MSTTVSREDVINRYELMSIEEGYTKVTPVENLSTEFMLARINFADWYDAKSEDEQQLIDEISDRTYFIVDEDEYDEFIAELADYGITTAEQFEMRFRGEWGGVHEEVLGKFSEDLVEDVYPAIQPEFVANCIDWQQVWYHSLRYDFNAIPFKGNTYFFHIF